MVAGACVLEVRMAVEAKSGRERWVGFLCQGHVCALGGVCGCVDVCVCGCACGRMVVFTRVYVSVCEEGGLSKECDDRVCVPVYGGRWLAVCGGRMCGYGVYQCVCMVCRQMFVCGYGVYQCVCMVCREVCEGRYVWVQCV